MSDRPGVYKMPMVRILCPDRTQATNPRMYGSKGQGGRKGCPCHRARSVGLSMNANEEKPYTVTGGIRQTGLKRKPTGICTDRKTETREANNAEGRIPVKRWRQK